MMMTMTLLFGCEDLMVNPTLQSADRHGLQNRGNSGNDDPFMMGS